MKEREGVSSLWVQGTGRLRGGLTINGLLVRDLQLHPASKFAYFLRPLPARAEELTQHATKFRTRMLRVVNTSAARRRCARSRAGDVYVARYVVLRKKGLTGRSRRWYWAVRKLILRQRSALPATVMESRMFVQTAALPFTSFVGLKTTGPQLVACCYLPPAHKYPGHPEYRPAPPAKLQIQVLLNDSPNHPPLDAAYLSLWMLHWPPHKSVCPLECRWASCCCTCASAGITACCPSAPRSWSCSATRAAQLRLRVHLYVRAPPASKHVRVFPKS